jgi:CubicO group peptidase (beta-lactamase class C family)
MIRSLPTVALLVVLAAPAVGQSLPVGAPEDVGMSSERLRLIGEVLRSEIDQDMIPGAVVAVARRGRLVYHESFGYLDKAAGTPMPRDAIFPIASLTKPIVAAASMILLEEGRLSMSDPVGRHIPELAAKEVAVSGSENGASAATVPARRQPTVQDLLRHTHGFSTTPGPGSLTAQQFVDSLARLPLVHQPGTVWEYGLGLDLAGLVIERITHERLGDFLEERLFGPLGMDDTGFGVPSSKHDRYAVALPVNPLTGRPQGSMDRRARPPFDCGGGCLSSTAADYLRFAQMLLAGGSLGGRRILGPRTVRYMTAIHTTPDIDLSALGAGWPNAQGYGFGLGVAVRAGDGVSPMMGTRGDYNWGGASGTYFWVDPEEELAVVFMAMAPGALRLRYRHLMPTLVLQSITE